MPAGNDTIEVVVFGAGMVINPASKIGRRVIGNTRASVDRDCTPGDGASLGPGATLGGNVTVGRGSHGGLGARVKQGITVGTWCMIGAGAAVVDNIPDLSLALGVPATVRRRLSQPEATVRGK